MGSLTKRGDKYLYKLSVRVGERELSKKKVAYIPLNTSSIKEAHYRQDELQELEDKIRLEIRLGESSIMDLLNMKDSLDYEWTNGKRAKRKVLSLKEHIETFIEYKESRNFRATTIDSYKYALNKFMDCLGSSFLLAEIKETHIVKFNQYLKAFKPKNSVNGSLSLSTIDTNLKALNVFLQWAYRLQHIARVPLIELHRPVLEDKWLTESEYNAILDYEGYSSNRFPKMFKLYGETGMRLSEGFNGVLTEDDNGIWLSIPNEFSKSGKGRTIQLNEEQRDTIQMIQTLWIENDCRPDHIKYYSRIFAQVRDKLKISKHKRFHSLRHYFGKTMVTKTGNIYEVSGLMGHSSIGVTEENYVKTFNKQQTLKDFPSLKEFLSSEENSSKNSWGTQKGVHKATNKTAIMN